MKSALVKVVLCDKCLKKLMWKRDKERADGDHGEGLKEDTSTEKETERRNGPLSSEDISGDRRDWRDKRDRDSSRRKERRRDKSSRSQSPRRRDDKTHDDQAT